MNRRRFLIGTGLAVVLGGSVAELISSRRSAYLKYEEGIAPLRAPLNPIPSARELIRYATLAANGHNTQPWKFRIGDKQIDILPDFSRRTSIVDPDNHHLYVSLGASAENLALASAARGAPGVVGFDLRAGGGATFNFDRAKAIPSLLFQAITKRQSTRAIYDGNLITSAMLNKLASTAQVPGVEIVLLTERSKINQLSNLVLAGNSAQMADPNFVQELKSWLRYNPEQALSSGDGLFSVASGNPALPDWLGPDAFDWFINTNSENKKYDLQIKSSAGIAVFVGAQANPLHWLAVGQACQRFALQATAMGLKHAFINQPVEVTALRTELADIIGLKDKRPDIVMRFGYGPTLPYSARRPVDDIII